MPTNWSAYFCLKSCFFSTLDSLTITENYGVDTLYPGDEIRVFLHILMSKDEGSGTIELKVGNLNTPSDVKHFTIMANTTQVSISEQNVPLNNYSLNQNYPNPFNPSTQINYQIPKAGFTNLVVYNMLGQVVAELVNEYQLSGKYSVQFNATNLPSGVYIYKLQAGEFNSTKKMMLLK